VQSFRDVKRKNWIDVGDRRLAVVDRMARTASGVASDMGYVTFLDGPVVGRVYPGIGYCPSSSLGKP